MGADETAAPVVADSHLDSQPTGSIFDGVYGVLAALEVSGSAGCAACSHATPIELVVWTNEEGSRFQPTKMGSAVHAGALPLAQALAAKDREGISVADALAELAPFYRGAMARSVRPADRGLCRNHIEQTPRSRI